MKIQALQTHRCHLIRANAWLSAPCFLGDVLCVQQGSDKAGSPVPALGLCYC